MKRAVFMVKGTRKAVSTTEIPFKRPAIMMPLKLLSGQQRRLDLHVEVQRKGDAKVVRLGEGLLTKTGPVFGDFAHLRLPVHRQHVEDHIPTEAIGEEGPRDAKHPFAISVQQTELRPPPGPVLLDGAQQAVAGGAAHLQLLDTLAGGVDHPVLVVGLPAGERLQQLHLLPDRQLIDDGQVLQPSWNTSGIGVRRQRSKHVINCAKGVKEEVLSNKIIRKKTKYLNVLQAELEDESGLSNLLTKNYVASMFDLISCALL
ncbi:hypothetical protein TYRP_017164 [Tyrophagus putrescentiae]|nr:hypothetical protein TYRP_017164 [Tyrophagus putrescentiae]